MGVGLLVYLGVGYPKECNKTHDNKKLESSKHFVMLSILHEYDYVYMCACKRMYMEMM